TSEESCRMRFEMPHPCSGPRARVLRISRSSVPWRSSALESIGPVVPRSEATRICTDRHDKHRYRCLDSRQQVEELVVDCQGIELWRPRSDLELAALHFLEEVLALDIRVLVRRRRQRLVIPAA